MSKKYKKESHSPEYYEKMFSNLPKAPTRISTEKKPDLRTNIKYKESDFPLPYKPKKKTPPKSKTANQIENELTGKSSADRLLESLNKRDKQREEQKKNITKKTSWFSSLFSRGGRKSQKRQKKMDCRKTKTSYRK
jgi:hypothetical protein